MLKKIDDVNRQLLEKLMKIESSEVSKTITNKKKLIGAFQLVAVNLVFHVIAISTNFIVNDTLNYLICSFIIFTLTAVIALVFVNQARLISKTISVLYEVGEREARLADFSKFNEEKTNLKSTAQIAKLLSQSLGVQDEAATEIAESTKYLDLGQTLIDDELKKKKVLTNEDFNKMKEHVEIGYKISKMMGQPQIISNVIRYHHERWDGSGYLNGLSKEDIPLEARIVAVCDVYDALTHDRANRKANTHEKAIEIIKSESGKYFDPAIVQKFLELEPKVKELNGVN